MQVTFGQKPFSNLRPKGAQPDIVMRSNVSLPLTLPNWIPDAVRLYLDHTASGLSLRALARRDGLHASTILRQVRRYETRRDDPLLDEALDRLAQSPMEDAMSATLRHPSPTLDEAAILHEGRRILRRLAEPGAVLAIAPDLERAVVLREFPDGRTARTGVVERKFAHAFALKEWISLRKAGRVTTYELSSIGRLALKRLIDEAPAGLAEAPNPFADQHREWEEKELPTPEGPRRMRYNLAENPVAVLGRRKDKDGMAFLSPELIGAAERLREDFELAQMGPRVAQNWDRFLTMGDRGGFRGDAGIAEGPRAARDRVAAALRDLGPGLGDVALRVCCFLDGIEAAEQRMGWAARSGKIVLRIALQRLRRHYDETYGKTGPRIG
jgi:hypothetical protein